MKPIPATAAVAGAGTMGTGIACVLALGGSAVRVVARSEATLAAAASRVDSIARALGAPDPAALTARLSFTSSLEHGFDGAELVVESIAEDLRAKTELLAVAERFAAPGAILATNTSSLSIASLSAPLERPDRFAGLHWFNPPELVPLVEVVAGERTDPEVVETLRDWMEALGKAPIVLRRDTPGFVANRLQYGLVREAWALVEEGVCGYEDVDRALTHGLGARWAAVGPFQIADLAGLDVYLAVIRNLYPELSTAQSPSPRPRGGGRIRLARRQERPRPARRLRPCRSSAHRRRARRHATRDRAGTRRRGRRREGLRTGRSGDARPQWRRPFRRLWARPALREPRRRGPPA